MVILKSFLILTLMSLLNLSAHSQSIQPVCSPQVLAKAKQQQTVEYNKLKKSYEYWTKEAVRLADYPKETARCKEAQAQANKLSSQAQDVISAQHLSKLIAQESKLDLAHQRQGQAIVDAEEKRRQAIADAKEMKRQEELERQRQLQAKAKAQRQEEIERQQEAVRLAVFAQAAREAQIARDSETFGILNEDKFERLQVGMSVNRVEQILGPGKNLGSQTVKFGNSQIEITDYRWACSELSGVCVIRFDEDGLFRKEVSWN